MLNKRKRIAIIKLDCDDPEKIRKFKEAWEKAKPEVMYIPASTNIIFRTKKKKGRN